MSGLAASGAQGSGGSAAARAGGGALPKLHTVTLDGGLLDAAASARPVGGPSSRAGPRGSPRRGAGQARSTWGSASQRHSPATAASGSRGGGERPRQTPGTVMLDKGEAEASFIGALRSHYARNGTAESFAPKFSTSPHSAYGGGGASEAPPGRSPGRSATGPAWLEQQERQLWQEREEELVDAQERRFAQLEDALAAREAKRETYLVHRLEASAADKIQEHRRRQEAAARERQLAAQRAQHLPSLKQAHAATLPPARAASLRRLAARPVFPASAGLAAAVGQTTASISSLSGISTMQAGLESQQAFSPGALGGASAATRAQPGLPRLGSGRLGWREKREAEAARLVDQAYSHIKATKATGGRLLSPLDAAKEAGRRRLADSTPAPRQSPSTSRSWERGVEEHAAAYEARLAAARSEDGVPLAAGCQACARAGSAGAGSPGGSPVGDAAWEEELHDEEPAGSPAQEWRQPTASPTASAAGGEGQGPAPELQLEVAEAVEASADVQAAEEAAPAVLALVEAEAAALFEEKAAGGAEDETEEAAPGVPQGPLRETREGSVSGPEPAQAADEAGAEGASGAQVASSIDGCRSASSSLPLEAPSAEGSSQGPAGSDGIPAADALAALMVAAGSAATLSPDAEQPHSECAPLAEAAPAEEAVGEATVEQLDAPQLPEALAAPPEAAGSAPAAAGAAAEAAEALQEAETPEALFSAGSFAPALRLVLLPEEIAAFETDKAAALAAAVAKVAVSAAVTKAEAEEVPQLPGAAGGSLSTAEEEPALQLPAPADAWVTVNGAAAGQLPEERPATASRPLRLSMLPEEIAAFVLSKAVAEAAAEQQADQPAGEEGKAAQEAEQQAGPAAGEEEAAQEAEQQAGEVTGKDDEPQEACEAAAEEAADEVATAPELGYAEITDAAATECAPPQLLLAAEGASAEGPAEQPTAPAQIVDAVDSTAQDGEEEEEGPTAPPELLLTAGDAAVDDAQAAPLRQLEDATLVQQQAAVSADGPGEQVTAMPLMPPAVPGAQGTSAEELEQAGLLIVQQSLLEHTAQGLALLLPGASFCGDAGPGSGQPADRSAAAAAEEEPGCCAAGCGGAQPQDGPEPAGEHSAAAAADADEAASQACGQGERSAAAVTAADSAEQVQLTGRASASLMFGGGSEVQLLEGAGQPVGDEADPADDAAAEPAPAAAGAEAPEADAEASAASSDAGSDAGAKSADWELEGEEAGAEEAQRAGGEVISAMDLCADLARPAPADDRQ
ncbi:hypothetical protein CHLNCDRAFT_51510 [Chlorella variabilis]|uniref:CFAP91 domain-containing protein n=1 Tax=Chlorella variabilis TaxID=554065 RepID=E1ZC23_CHLVA|nr:hypothetical protein CHLNCDRAFT_51510 [Chlorella variabilis]EFN56738.1 hypothetical protein CHLNCDRAFT_51510 [Chlorella variabilis]|eukprot:XP_005848840.1 hypothetical protein CHLNCDRAFT_51510 [Chlorella variabilis]